MSTIPAGVNNLKWEIDCGWEQCLKFEKLITAHFIQSAKKVIICIVILGYQIECLVQVNFKFAVLQCSNAFSQMSNLHVFITAQIPPYFRHWVGVQTSWEVDLVELDLLNQNATLSI